MIVELSIHTVSEANQASHQHWRKRQQRAKEQRRTTRYGLYGRMGRLTGLPVVTFPLTIILTRIAPRRLDDDNLQGALKHVRDGVADWLDMDDGNPSLIWQYGQQRGNPREYAVRIEITQKITDRPPHDAP